MPESANLFKLKCRVFYTKGKLHFASNQYEAALEAYDTVIETSKNLSVFYQQKYTAKAIENKASVIVLTSNYTAVQALIKEAESIYESNPLNTNEELRIKFNIKKAQLLKKCSFFQDSYNLLEVTLKDLEDMVSAQETE